MTEQPKKKKNKGGARLEKNLKAKEALDHEPNDHELVEQGTNVDEAAGERPDGPEISEKEKRARLIMILAIIGAALMILIAAVALLWSRWVKKPSLPPAVTPQPSSPAASASQSPQPGVSESPDPDVTETPFELGFDPVEPKVSGERKSEDFYTILVFGTDEVSGLTDTIMVVSYDVTNQKATVMSIPRDTLVNVRRAYKSINGVYGAGGRGESGINALKNEVSELIGFVPDYHVMIEWELVGKMVDAIGGVRFNIPYHMDYDDPAQDLYIHFDPGEQLLNGEDAMRVVRWRKNNRGSPYYGEGGGGDTGRLNVQHDFLKAVLKQTLQITNVTKVGQLAQLFGEDVVSDLTVENLFWFGSQAIFGGLKVEDVDFITMPYFGVGREDSPYNGRVYPNWNALLRVTNESLNPFVQSVTMRQLDLIRVNEDDTLTSSTGVLADPSAAIPPEKESGSPEDGEDGEDVDPLTSDDPSGEYDDPPTGDDPEGSDDPDDLWSGGLPQWPSDPGTGTSPAPSDEPEPEPSATESADDWDGPHV